LLDTRIPEDGNEKLPNQTSIIEGDAFLLDISDYSQPEQSAGTVLWG